MRITKAFIISVCLSLSTSFVAAAENLGANTDCHVGVRRLVLVHGCIYTTGSGPGPCENWMSLAPEFYAPLERTSLNHYQLEDAAHGLKVSVVFNGLDRARIAIAAPGVSKTNTVYTRNDAGFPDASLEASYRNRPRLEAYDYDVHCSFGLSDAVRSQKDIDTAKMNELGPAAEWRDPSAASVQALPLGTVLELTPDLDIIPGTDTGLTKFVEMNGLMTEGGFLDLKLPYRYAYAEFFNANNGYLERTHYPKGMRLEVVKVATNQFSSGGQSYDLTLKLISSGNVLDPITRLTVTGRRSGEADIKIPQLAELLRPAMSLQLPLSNAENLDHRKLCARLGR